ncbi:hypothetical protein ACIRPP_18025 [Streptomyces sp. NPDC101219]|uniref:hypothetical protein n=1 Tax=Streptomyces sp. NPDC101219 TaxID=3366131 RepID=UPI00381D4F2B
MNIRKRSLSKAAVVLGAAALVMGTASGAWADGDPITVKTTDDNPGGWATFWPNGEKFTVTDHQADGMRASGYIRFNGKTYRLDDANGASTGSSAGGVSRDFSIAEGTKVEIKVCLRDGANGAAKFCSAWRAALA